MFMKDKYTSLNIFEKFKARLEAAAVMAKIDQTTKTFPVPLQRRLRYSLLLLSLPLKGAMP
jgi:hypothetical protein